MAKNYDVIYKTLLYRLGEFTLDDVYIDAHNRMIKLKKKYADGELTKEQFDEEFAALEKSITSMDLEFIKLHLLANGYCEDDDGLIVTNTYNEIPDINFEEKLSIYDDIKETILSEYEADTKKLG